MYRADKDMFSPNEGWNQKNVTEVSLVHHFPIAIKIYFDVRHGKIWAVPQMEVVVVAGEDSGWRDTQNP